MNLPAIIKKTRPRLIKLIKTHGHKPPTHRGNKIKETKSLEETVAELNRLSNMAAQKAS